jgi:hypothetical protein
VAETVIVDFPKNFAKALGDGQLRRNLRAAMDTLGMRRRTLFSDPVAFEQQRSRGDAIRQRASTLGAAPDYAPLPDLAAAAAGHRALSQGIVDTLIDLDLLQRSGIPAADQALMLVRTHLGGRAVRDVQTLVVGAGMLGRG